MTLTRPALLSLFSVMAIFNEAFRTTCLVQRPVFTTTTLFSSETSDDSSSSNIQSNKDLFGGNPSAGTAVQTPSPLKSSVIQVEKYKDEAQRLRKEAAEMEVSLREEARAKGLSEDMINKLIPLRSATAPVVSSPVAAKQEEEIPKEKFLATEVRSKLGYLNAGDAVRMTSELDRVKGRGFIRLWNSKEFAVGTKFQASVTQLTSRTGIEPI
eukprot:gene24625-32070_t